MGNGQWAMGKSKNGVSILPRRKGNLILSQLQAPSLRFHTFLYLPLLHYKPFFLSTDILPSSLLMASLSLPKHSLPFLLPTQIPKTPALNSLPLVSKSSHSQFYGLTFSSSPALPLPLPSSSSPRKPSIFAKVHCFNLKFF